MRTIAWALGSVLVISLVPLVWLLAAPARLRARSGHLLSFAVGALLGSAALHLLPAAFDRLGGGLRLSAGLLGGFVGFFVLEILLGRHTHDAGRSRLPPIAALNLLGDGLHNAIDGVLIAAAYTTDVSLGLATSVAVLLHEIPQEIGDMGVLTYSGLPVRRAVWYNVLSGMAAVAGAGLTLVIGARVRGATDLLLPVAAGAFIYVAASDLIPELRADRSRTAATRQTLLVLLGMLVIAIPRLLE
jgi:zinc and cadmium transporter